MAGNGIQYEGRLINNNGQTKVSRSKAGNVVISFVVAESFQEKNKSAPSDKKDPNKGPEDYVDVSTAWHRGQIMGSAAEELAKNPLFNHGAVLDISASYREDAKEWVDKGNITRVSRSETVFSDREDGTHFCDIKVSQGGVTLGARDEWAKPLWDGVSELPSLGGGGGGAPAAPQYNENEGF